MHYVEDDLSVAPPWGDLTPEMAERGLMWEMKHILNLTAEISDICDQAAAAKVEFKKEFAKARIQQRADWNAAGRKYNADMVDDEATVKTTDLAFAAEMAESRRVAATIAHRTHTERQASWRTLNANVRSATTG